MQHVPEVLGNVRHITEIRGKFIERDTFQLFSNHVVI